jgi:cell division protein FtsI (penicillin-binding protein 3)
MGARLFTSPYEPGSIIKPLVVASMIERGLISPYTEIVAPSRYTVAGGAKIKDSFEHPPLNLTTNGVVVQSSNTGLSTLAEGLTKKQRYEILTAWGMGSPTPVEFLGEDPGYVTDPDEVDDVTQFTQLFGQGMTVTSAQMAQIYQALGNSGVLVPLTLVTKCTAADGTSMREAPTDTHRIVSDDAAVQTIAMMENAAVFGSAANAVRVPGYRVAVKTGTAEVAKNGGYTDDRIISVAGLAPAENPQYAVVVTIGMPKFRKSSYYAGPAFAAIMGQVLKYNRVPPSSGETMVYPIYWGKDAN